MATHLGCSFDNENVMFEHPVTKDPVVVILDPFHMVKLIRNAVENLKTSSRRTTDVVNIIGNTWLTLILYNIMKLFIYPIS